MPRPSRIDEQRRKLLPIVARAFGELGYRRATTAELAARCGVRENILYRMWPDKRQMFLAALDSLYQARRDEWEGALRGSKGAGTRAEALIEHVAAHYGGDTLARVIFSGLAETDDREIREALTRLYENYHAFIEREIRLHRKEKGTSSPADARASAWALIGLGTILNVLEEVGHVPPARRRAFFARTIREIAPLLVGGSDG